MAKDVTRNVIFNYLIGKNTVGADTEKLKRSMNDLGGSINNMAQGAQGSLKQLAGAYNALIVAKHATRAIGGMFAPAVKMQTALTDLAVATGLSGEGLEQVKKAAQEAAAITPFDPVQAIESARRLNLVMRDVDTTTKALGPTMALASTYLDKDLNAASTLATKLMGGFQLSGEQLANTMGQLAMGARAMGVQVKDVIGGFKTLGIAAGTLRTTFDDIYLGYLLAIRGSVPATTAANLMNTALLRLSRPVIRKGLQENLGVIVQHEGRFLSFRKILLQLTDAYKRMGPGGAVQFAHTIEQAFGARTAKVILPMIQQMIGGVKTLSGEVKKGADLLDYYASQTSNVGNALVDATKQAMTPLQRRIEVLKESWGVLLTNVFLPTVDAITPIVGGLASIVKAITAVVETVPGLRLLIAGLVRVGVIFMSLASIMMIWRGASAIASAAFAVIGIDAAMTGAAFVGAGARLGGFIKSMFAAKSAVAGLKIGFTGLKLAVKGFFGAILGPLGLILTFLPEIWGLIKKVFGLGEDKGTKQLGKAQANVAQSVNKLTRPIAEMGSAADDMKDVMKQWQTIRREKLPMPSPKVIAQLGRRIDELDKSGSVYGKGLGRLREMYKTVEAVQNKITRAKPGDRPTPEEMVKAQAAMQNMTRLMGGFYAFDTKFVKGMEATGQAYTMMAGGTQEMAKVFALFGVYSKEQHALNQEALAKLREEVGKAQVGRFMRQSEILEKGAVFLRGMDRTSRIMSTEGPAGVMQAAREEYGRWSPWHKERYKGALTELESAFAAYRASTGKVFHLQAEEAGLAKKGEGLRAMASGAPGISGGIAGIQANTARMAAVLERQEKRGKQLINIDINMDGDVIAGALVSKIQSIRGKAAGTSVPAKGQ